MMGIFKGMRPFLSDNEGKRQKQVFKKAKRMAQSAKRKTETGIASW